jgi:hypothetical protein
VTNGGGHWLTRQRLRLYPKIMLAVFVGHFLFAWLAPNLDQLFEYPGAVIKNDFAVFWTAGRLLLEGRAATAYDPEATYEAEQSMIAGFDAELPWVYPPHYQLVVAPFAALPFFPAFLAWSLLTLALLVVALWRLAPMPETPWLVLGFPLTYLVFTFGQNGYLTAALLALALYFLGRRQDLAAGVMLGLLTIKPQLGVLVPFALIAAARWQAIVSATATFAILVVGSGLLLGWELWPLFFETMQWASGRLEAGILPWKHLSSVFTAARIAGLPTAMAYAMHGAVVLAVIVSLCLIWRRDEDGTPFALKGALLASGSLLAAPYLFSYDLMFTAVALVLLAWDGLRRGWLAGEPLVLTLLWFYPFAAAALTLVTMVPLTVLGSIALYGVAWRRARASAAGRLGKKVISRSPRGE